MINDGPTYAASHIRLPVAIPTNLETKSNIFSLLRNLDCFRFRCCSIFPLHFFAFSAGVVVNGFESMEASTEYRSIGVVRTPLFLPSLLFPASASIHSGGGGDFDLRG